MNETNQCLATKAIESAALSLQGIDNVHGRDSLALSMVSVGDRVTDDRLEEHAENSAGLFVDQVADALDTTTARKTADGGLGNALNVVTQNLAMALGAALS